MDELKSASLANKPLTRTLRSLRSLERPRIFLAFAGLFVLLLIVWAGLAEVHRVVRVDGRIIPAGRNQNIQHLEGGIVASINVKEGGIVHKGDLLLTIDSTNAGAALGELGVKLSGQEIRAIRLRAEIDDAAQLKLPESLRGKPSAETERQLFFSNRDEINQELAIYREQAAQRTAEIKNAKTHRAQLRAEEKTAQKRLVLLRGLAEKGAASRLEVLDAQSQRQRLDTELSEVEQSLPSLLSSVSEANARSAEAKARYRAKAQAELAETLVEIERLRKTKATQTDRLSRTEIRAPVDGVVNRVAVNTVGGVVKAGESIVEITPTAGPLSIVARARPRDRGELRDGLPVRIRVSAYDSGILGLLDGYVADVSADTVPDAKGDAYYRLLIRVDKLPADYADRLLVPGMTITGDVVIGKRTVLAYVTSPLSKFSAHVFQDAQ